MFLLVHPWQLRRDLVGFLTLGDVDGGSRSPGQLTPPDGLQAEDRAAEIGQDQEIRPRPRRIDDPSLFAGSPNGRHACNADAGVEPCLFGH